jgi:hydrogenase maturation protease
VTLLDGGTAGLETVLLLQGRARAIILDAADIGSSPGAWRRWHWRDAALEPGSLEGTLHGAGLAEALALGEVLGILPENIVIYGVQPGDVGWSPGLSGPVQDAIPAICQDILDGLFQNDTKGRQSDGEDSRS